MVNLLGRAGTALFYRIIATYHLNEQSLFLLAADVNYPHSFEENKVFTVNKCVLIYSTAQHHGKTNFEFIKRNIRNVWDTFTSVEVSRL